MHVILMLPPAGDSKAERWVAAGRRACADDLTRRLLSIDSIKHINALVADEEALALFDSLGVEASLSAGETFHFGPALSEMVAVHDIKHLAYFGGASAPLLQQQELETMIDKVLSAQDAFGIANNKHSTDWLLTNEATIINAHSQQLPSDNPLGWVLSHEAGVRIESTAPSAATRLDVDTPADLFMAWKHPGAGRALSAFLEDLPTEVQAKLIAIHKVLQTPASTIAVIGRASAQVWKELVAQTQIWIRLYVEERGMVASHRLAKGEVRSLVGHLLDRIGPQEFIEHLSSMADAALWDTRVWMGTQPEWPSNSDRFAADLGWVDAIEDSVLRELTAAIEDSAIPILAGGYGVVGGGLHAMIENLARD